MQQHSQADELTILQKRVATHPESLQEVIALADTYAMQGRWDDALKTYKSAIELDPKDANLYNDLGTIYEEVGDSQKGEQAYQKAIELRPDHSTAYLNLGLLYEEQGRSVEAVKAFEKCLEMSPYKEERSKARKNIRVTLEQNADVIQPEDYGPEVIKLTADTITGQSRLAYYLAAVVLFVGAIINLIGLFMGNGLLVLAILIDIVMAVGLLQLRAGARYFTIFRATLGAILLPIIVFATNDFTTAILASLIQWGYCGALLLILTGQSRIWRLALAVGIFLATILCVFGFSLLALVLDS